MSWTPEYPEWPAPRPETDYFAQQFGDDFGGDAISQNQALINFINEQPNPFNPNSDIIEEPLPFESTQNLIQDESPPPEPPTPPPAPPPAPTGIAALAPTTQTAAVGLPKGALEQATFEDRPTSGRSAMEQRDDLANMLAEKQNPDSEVVTALAKQILASSNTSKWTGQGRGSAEANARDMAKIMAGIGITDIKQFGPITREVEAYVGTDDVGNPIYETQTEKTFGNKETGQAVPLTYSERQKGDFFGGTFAGEGNTGYGVRFDAQGNPIFYTQGATSNDLAILMQDMGPVFQIGLALATGGLSVPQQIAARMAVNVLSGQDVGDAIKGAAISMAVVNIPGMDFMKEGGNFIKGLDLGDTVTKTLTNSFQNAVTSGATAALTGQDVSDAMVTGAISGGVNGAVGALLNSADMKDLTKDLSATQKQLVSNAVSGVISGKPIDQILINTAIAAANAEINNIKNPPSTAGVDKTTIGNFDDTEITRLQNLGYTKNQIQDYFRSLENLTGAFDDTQDPIPVNNTSNDIVKKLENAGLTQSSDAEQLASITRSINQLNNENPTITRNKNAEDNEVLINAQLNAQLKAREDAEAAARAEQERLAREAQQAAEAARIAREKEAQLATEAKNLRDADNLRKAKEEADRLAKEAKDAENVRKAQEAELLITAKRKADDEAARVAEEARKAQEAQLAREAQQAAEVARKIKEAKDAEDARKIKEAQQAEDARKAKEAEDARKAQELEDARKAKEAEVLITTKKQADAEAARIAEAKKAEQERIAREAQQASETARKAKEAEDARKAQELEAARIAELERIRQTEIENERQAEIARKAQESEILITAKRKADEEAAARLAEQERLAREAQQAAIALKKLQEIEIVGNLDKPKEHVFDPTFGGILPPPYKNAGELTIVGNLDKPKEHVFDPTFGGTMPLPSVNAGELTIVGNRPVNYLPTDVDFPSTPIPTTPGAALTPKAPAPTAAKPAPPAASPSMDLNGLLALLGGQQPAQQAPMQDPYAHIKLMEELFGPTINLTPAGENTSQRK